MSSTSSLTLDESCQYLNDRFGSVLVSSRSLEAMIEAGGLPQSPLSEAVLDQLVTSTHRPSAPGFSYVRVSVLPRRPEAPLRFPDGSVRTQVGVQIGAMKGRHARLAWTGIWPLSEDTCADAAGAQLPLLGSLRGWIHRSVARRITGYTLVEPGRRLLHTKRLTSHQEQVLFAGKEWAHIPVGRGAIAALEEL